MPDLHKMAQKVLSDLEATFRRLEGKVPAPAKIRTARGDILRYQERLPQQALLQKFARQISGLHALELLIIHGFLQEQGVIQRTLDEIHEDIVFLVIGLSAGELTKDHETYLKAFWAEGLDEDPAKLRTVSRGKIRAAINRQPGLKDPSTADANGKKIYQAYSGYVHAASTNIMDMCVGEPPRYQLSGMRGSPFYADHVNDAWNYFYRALISAAFIAKAFNDEQLFSEQVQIVCLFESTFGEQLFGSTTSSR